MATAEERKEKRDNVRRTIREMTSLPTLPTIVLEFEEAMRDANLDAGVIAEVIEKDMSTASRLLKVANSAYYGPAYGEIADIRQAVTRLGTNEVRRLVISLSLITVFPNEADHVDPVEFWRHSLGAAAAAREIAVRSPVICIEPDELYSAGLLHDIGWLVLDQFLPNMAVSIVKKSRSEGATRREAEMEVLGTDHGEVGGMLLDRWRLPVETIEAVSWHHEPETAAPDATPLARAVQAADLVCREADIGDSGEGPVETKPLMALQALGFGMGEAPQTIAGLVEAARQTAGIINALS